MTIRRTLDKNRDYIGESFQRGMNMNLDELQNHIDFLFSAALAKCGDTENARDLTQETLLAALVYQKKGGIIQNFRRWLLAVMNRKYYDGLRQKYRIPTVTIGENFDMADDADDFSAVGMTDEEEAVRREVAYLAEKYRTLIVRHYFHGESVADLAVTFGIPTGTVKSRLDFGRKQMKKGLDSMETYRENSYAPKKMHLRNSGSSGLNDEPMSLVPDDDVLAQNLLLLAYEKPVTVSDLACAIGIPAAYIEPVIRKLISGELMCRMGDGKVYTDFVIYEPDDYIKYIREAEAFVSEHSADFLEPMRDALEKLREKPYWSERLARYMLISIAANIIWDSAKEYRKPQIFPERPNGGRWIAFGNILSDKPFPPERCGKEEYPMSGERGTKLSEYLEGKDLLLLNYETSLYPYSKYDSFDYSNFGEMETDILRLFYLIEKGIAPESVGFPEKMLKNIPFLIERGFLTKENGGLSLLVPHLTHEQAKAFSGLIREASQYGAEKLTVPMGEYLADKRKKIPPHLTSMPDQKLTMPYEIPAMALVYEAIGHGLHRRDLGYPCPETIVVFD